MKQLKVGDEVIVVSTSDILPFYKKGDIGKIINVDRAYSLGLVFRVKFYVNNYQTWVLNDHIKLTLPKKSYLWHFFNTGIQS